MRNCLFATGVLCLVSLTGAACQQSARVDASGNAVSERRALYGGMVSRAAFSAGVPEHIAHAVVRVESGYNPRARGRAGEWGLMQIKCGTARGIGFSGSCAELADPATNLEWGMRYLAEAVKKGGAGCAGITLYNTGIAARPRCRGYGRTVIRAAD